MILADLPDKDATETTHARHAKHCIKSARLVRKLIRALDLSLPGCLDWQSNEETSRRGKTDLILESVLRVEKFLHEIKASIHTIVSVQDFLLGAPPARPKNQVLTHRAADTACT